MKLVGVDLGFEYLLRKLKAMLDQELKNDRGEWDSCPAGELTRMVRRIDAAHRRKQTFELARTGMFSMLLVACGVLVFGNFFVARDFTFGGISCTECVQHFPAYHDHLKGEVAVEDVELLASLETHLAKCERCQSNFRKMYSDVALDQLTGSTLQFRPLLPNFAVAVLPVSF